MDDPDLDFWKLRMEWAEYHRQPIYVTHEEYREIRDLTDRARNEAECHGYVPPPWVAGVIAPMGTPVVIDAANAHRQKLEMMG